MLGGTALGLVAGVPVALAYPVITGHVTDPSGNPVDGCNVELFRYQSSIVVTDLDLRWSSPVETEQTGADGGYTITYPGGDWGGAVGWTGPYALLFEGPNVGAHGGSYRPLWYDQKEGYPGWIYAWSYDVQAATIANQFALTADTDMTSIDATIEPYQGNIACAVTDFYTGLPIPGVYVTLYHYDPWIIGADILYQDDAEYTDANGQYSCQGTDPTDAPGSFWTLLFEKNGYPEVWLGNVGYQSAVAELTQAQQAGVTHVAVDSNATSTVSIVLVPYPVSTSLSLPSVSPGSPTHGKTAKITSMLSPAAAATSGASTLCLSHWETKIVRKKVGTKFKNVKVWYWRLRSTVTMSGSASPGKLTAKIKFAQTGKWKAYVTYAPATGQYLASTSHTKTFTVK
jgi:5-hydroxyisourate hydrolase-like protein (transthyretin family)